MKHAAALAVILLAAQASPAWSQEAWVVGQSAPLTGGNAQFGNDVRDGAAAYFAMLNAAGGVAGRKVELLTLDDKNDRKTAGANTKKLLENKNLVALFGYGSATLSLDAIPQAETAGVPFFAPFSGANPVRVKNPVLFTIRASYAEEMEAMLNHWTRLGFKKVSVVHYDDEVGKQNLEVVVRYLKKLDLAPTAFPIKRNATIGAAEVQALIDQQPEVIMNTTLSGAAAQVLKELSAKGKFVPTSSLSFVGAEQFIKAAGPLSAGVSIAQVVPSPRKPVPVVQECAKAMQHAGATTEMNTTHLEACIGAKVLAEGMRRARKPLTAATLRDALESMGAYDVGGYTVRFSPTGHHGSSFVELAMVTRDGRMTR